MAGMDDLLKERENERERQAFVLETQKRVMRDKNAADEIMRKGHYSPESAFQDIKIEADEKAKRMRQSDELNQRMNRYQK